MKMLTLFVSSTMLLLNTQVIAEDLLVGKVCPVIADQQKIGIIALSIPWFHNGREDASYTALDDATGVGIEIHYFNNQDGQLKQKEGVCERYRLLQVRETNAILDPGEQAIQIDVPNTFIHPFYDKAPLEFGRGTHLTPIDSADKPWNGQIVRSATVSLYDTPYISDAYGKEGEDIIVKFETCLVCQNENSVDKLLSCAHWGYVREYMGGMTGWSEPEVLDNKCTEKPTEQFLTALEQDTHHDYFYWFSWR